MCVYVYAIRKGRHFVGASTLCWNLVRACVKSTSGSKSAMLCKKSPMEVDSSLLVLLTHMDITSLEVATIADPWHVTSVVRI